MQSDGPSSALADARRTKPSEVDFSELDSGLFTSGIFVLKIFIMNFSGGQIMKRLRHARTIVGLCSVALAFLIVSEFGHAQQQTQEEGRARRVGANPSATPPKINTSPSSSPSASPSASPDDPGGVEIDPEETIKIDTNLVNVNVRVIDRNNRTVNDVRQEDFRVYEDGVLQKIEFASKEQVPISYGLAIDNSGSLRSQIVKVIEAGKSIINANKPGDETFLMRFVSNDKIEVKQDFSSDKKLLIEVLEDFYPEGGQTAVIDAVYLAAEHVAEYKKGLDIEDRRRRALIVVTDGEDRVSYYNQQQLFEALREEDVQIFIIGFVNELDDEKKGIFIRKSVKSKAVNLINQLADETGGRAFFPTSLSELSAIADEITRDMRTQYVVGYYPTNDRRDGSYRAIRVAIGDATGRDKRIAIARPGRTAPRDAQPAPTIKPSTSPGAKPTPTPRKP